MRWQKLGLVAAPTIEGSWKHSHAMLPTPFRLNDEITRVYVGFCDPLGVGRPGWVDVSVNDPTIVLGISEAPLFENGSDGSFDDNGAVPCSVVRADDGRVLMYYVGFELGVKIRYRLLTGLAESHDGGRSFRKVSAVPVLERSSTELFFRCGPWAVPDGRRIRLWYIGGSAWTTVSDKAVPVYDLRYVESSDGVEWPAAGRVVMQIESAGEHGFGRPCVIPRKGGGWRMFYSIRQRASAAYRLGYAESENGFSWRRMDDEMGLDVGPGAFDSDAIMYAAPFETGQGFFVFYNGNNFGRDGFGVAKLIAL